MNKPAETSNKIPKIMVFRPTLAEMKDFSKYLEYMESQGAHHGGLAKIIPPPEWVPRKSGYDNLNLKIKYPIKQIVEGGQGIYQQFNIDHRSMHITDFKKMAESPKHATPEYFDYDELESKYWKYITYNPPIYGADIPGSLTDPDLEEFNINKLNTILDLVCDAYKIKIKGVNTAYLYFGMWKSTFAWHTEDMDLYSINYLHFGAPKSWYCIPPEYGKNFEKLTKEIFKEQFNKCPEFLRHKMTLLSPKVLQKHSIPFNKITQEQGEFMITFPYSYHAGYNHGWNCAESTNFALPRWIEFGKRATVCACRNDSVKINMDVFVKKFQPDRYEKWLNGTDIGPDPKDPSNICASSAPFGQMCISKTTKSKRQPSRKLPQIETETFDNLVVSQENNNNNLDILVSNDDNKYQNVYETKRKKPKSNHNKSSNNKNNDSNLNNTDNNNSTNSTNGCDYNHVVVDSSNNNYNNIDNNNIDDSGNTKNSLKLITFGTENFNLNDEPIKSLNELSLRTLQYAENTKAFDYEIKLNYFSSLIDPFCSICIILRSFQFYGDLSKVNNLILRPPNNSQVLIPKSVLYNKIKQPTNNLESLIEKSDKLFICKTCKLCVHSSCYGINEMLNAEDWECDRCAAKDYEAACCLCPMRGGALKITTCNQWAHLTCALVLNNVKIENDILVKPIDITSVQAFLDSNRITCCYCLNKSNHGNITNYIIGCCIKCNGSDSCSEFFHVTCAYREGVLFELNDNLTSFKSICKKCQVNKIHRGKEFMHYNHVDINLDMRVIAKYDNHYYSFATVIGKFDELFHHVSFVDNSQADNIRTNDILNRDCEKELPKIGDLVEVIWHKEQLHGKYAGSHTTPLYNVLFDNGAQKALYRDDIYLLNENVPKRVLMKFIDNLNCLE